jgi:SAM-dependent methyltransferase
MHHPTLYDDPELYDRIVQPGPCEAFYRDLARRTGGPVLELACGTGRLTIPLAKAGHAVVGLDTSAEMLCRADTKARREGVEVTFVRGDMSAFDLHQLFPLVIVSCNSLAHLVTTEELRACLSHIARHLAPGGMFAFDIVHPDVRALGRYPSEPVRLDMGPNPWSAIGLEEIATYDPVGQIRVLEWRVTEPGYPSRGISPLVLRQIFPQELPLLLEAAGLQLTARYGDFAGNPLTGESLNQICVAEAQTN